MKPLLPIVLLGGLFSNVIAITSGCTDEAPLPEPGKILGDNIFTTDYQLHTLVLAPSKKVYGSMGPVLFRIEDGGTGIEKIAEFDDPIVGTYITPESVFMVSTDSNHRDSDTPCNLYISSGKQTKFKFVKEIKGGCALSWSMSSDANGHLYLGEYGPRENGLSKTVWKSVDYGMTWKAIFTHNNIEAKELNRTHIHRVAVDPFTDDVWVTVGDGRKNRGIYRSSDGGESWRYLIDSQATGIAFSPQKIFFGEDKKQGKVSMYDRQSGKTKEIFNASKKGNFGGSIYDLLIGHSGTLYVPTMKYADQSHIGTVWGKTGKEWRLLIKMPSEKGRGIGVETIAGPDADGWIYVPGYKILDR